MYQNFYNLNKKPFNITPDPEFLFLNPSQNEALASIIYGVDEGQGFISNISEVGLGKTTILRSYLERVDRKRIKVIYIFNVNVSFKILLITIFRELGINSETDVVTEMVDKFYHFLIEEYKEGRKVVLMIDEVQNMPVETLEKLRLLSNLETSTDKLIQIVLAGQPEFEKMLDLHELRQLKQRIAIRTRILPFTREESMAYIKNRLAKALIKDTPVFTKGALKRIINQAKGVPRTINILCDNALVAGFGCQQRPVSSQIVKEVISDLEGKIRQPILRWDVASAFVLLLIAGLFWFSVYKNRISFGEENLSHSQTTQAKAINLELPTKPQPLKMKSLVEQGKPFFPILPMADMQPLKDTSDPYSEEDLLQKDLKDQWAINFYSFPKKDDAISLLNKIKVDRYKVYITESNHLSKLWYRVRVGFFPTREEAKKMAGSLSKTYSLNSFWLVKPSRDEILNHKLS